MNLEPGTDTRQKTSSPFVVVGEPQASNQSMPSQTMASNYNRRTLPAEVMVEGGRYSVIRRRQTVDDLVALES